MELKLFNIATVKTNFPEADFWLIRKGSQNKVGMPTKIFMPQHIGIKVDTPEICLPTYLFYSITHLHNVGYFRRLAKGTLNLNHITVSDVENIRLGVRR